MSLNVRSQVYQAAADIVLGRQRATNIPAGIDNFSLLKRKCSDARGQHYYCLYYRTIVQERLHPERASSSLLSAGR